MNRPKVVGYIRVSKEKQAQDGTSLEAQRAKIEGFAQLYDYDLVAIIEDPGESAKTLDRPGLQRVLSMLDNGEASGVIVAKLDRLTRSVADLADLIEGWFNRYSLVSVGEQIDTSTAAGRLVLNVLMSVAQWEREAIGERTKAVLQHKKAQGQRVGSVPYGFRLAVDGVALVPEPAEQEIVTAVKELDAAGLSLRSISDHLARRGYTSRTGGVFHPQTVSNILKQAA